MNNLKATKRENTTSGQINELRAQGLIPAILYGGKDPNTKISIDKKSIANILNSDSFLSTVIELDIEGKKQKVLPREVAYHVVSDEPIHIDFMRIVVGSKIIIELPVEFKNHNLRFSNFTLITLNTTLLGDMPVKFIGNYFVTFV